MRLRLPWGVVLPAASLAALVAACAGTPGPAGTSCTIRPNDGGTGSTISCTDGTSVQVTNGRNGTNGTNGTNGSAGPSGTNGTNGADGMPCTVVANDAGTSTITCADGTTVVVHNGQDSSCTVAAGDGGTSTITCSDGTTATVRNGANGTNGTNGLGIQVNNLHGNAFLMSTGEFATAAKVFVDATITSVTADAAGVVTVNFRVQNRDTAHTPVTTLATVSATIVKLVPGATANEPSNWVPYIWTTETATAGAWPAPAGTTALQGNRETTGTLTNNRDGTYTYVLATNLATAMRGTTAVGYERNRTHRVAIMFGGHAGPTANAWLDFVPDGSAVTVTRNLIATSTCQSCHGVNQFHGHGGDRLSVEVCVTCHTEGATDAQSGNSLSMRNMIHKIHAGAELASIAGADGIVYDNPATVPNEAADNADYSIWGYRTTRLNWRDVEFPAVLSNCTKCHEGTGAQVNNWRDRPSRSACGSCHDTTSFAAGTTTHAGGEQADDSSCGGCHPATGNVTAARFPVTAVHDWMLDPRNDGEFDVALTISNPANGTHFVRGESPVVTMVLHDHATGALLDHTTIAEDPAAEACPAPYSAATCIARDGLFRDAGFFVSGPRALRVPVLTTAARSQVFSSGTGPWDISAAGASLVVQFDRGMDTHASDVSGGDLLRAGNVTVTVASAAAGTFPTPAAATTDQIVTWLNGNAAFRARGIAWNDSGRVGVRSRNLGTVFGIQLQASAVATAVFAGDLTVHVPGGYYAKNDLRSRTVPANNDPRVTRTAGSITYQLDPVDDLEPGTYVVFAEFADRGSTNATSYWAPSIARTNFQVGTATTQLPPAANCNSCHQSSSGRGLTMSLTSVHRVPFETNAIDWCGSCHDYQPQTATGATWAGAVPISRRVHGIHAADAWLNYPNATIGHADTVPGRNWRLPFPQDIRNCESCHPAGTTSGTWTQANRIACGGCHDSDAATAHLRAMTFDPTPADPFSGDEAQSCRACH